MAGTFQKDRAGYREFLRSTELAAALVAQAAPIEARAKGNAPVESGESATAHKRTPGKFRDSIHTEVHHGARRVVARVVADCEGAGPIEYRDHPLGRSV